MRWAAAAAVAWLAGCGGPAVDGDAAVSCEATHWGWAEAEVVFDVVLVIDDSPAMIGREAELEELLRDVARIVETMEGGVPSLHVAVAGGEGFEAIARRDGCALPDGAFLSDETARWWTCPDELDGRCGTPNYDGALGDALVCLAAVAPDGAAAPALFDAARAALGAGNPDAPAFRQGGHVMIVFVAAADDASPGDVDDHVAALRALVDDPDRLVVAAVTTPGNARVEALVGAFPQRSTLVSIDDAWSDVMEPMADVSKRTLGYSCFPGELDECYASAGSVAVPRCPMVAPDQPAEDAPIPCYWLRDDLAGCRVLTVEWDAWPGEQTDVRCAC